MIIEILDVIMAGDTKREYSMSLPDGSYRVPIFPLFSVETQSSPVFTSILKIEMYNSNLKLLRIHEKRTFSYIYG